MRARRAGGVLYLPWYKPAGLLAHLRPGSIAVRWFESAVGQTDDCLAVLTLVYRPFCSPWSPSPGAPAHCPTPSPQETRAACPPVATCKAVDARGSGRRM